MGHTGTGAHSYELIARYVMPRFQGSLTSLEDSAAWTVKKGPELLSLAAKAVERATGDYLVDKPGS